MVVLRIDRKQQPPTASEKRPQARDMWHLQDRVAVQEEKNQALALRNSALAAEVMDLAEGQDAIAEIARVDLGYIQSGETYYRLVRRNP